MSVKANIFIDIARWIDAPVLNKFSLLIHSLLGLVSCRIAKNIYSCLQGLGFWFCSH